MVIYLYVYYAFHYLYKALYADEKPRMNWRSAS